MVYSLCPADQTGGLLDTLTCLTDQLPWIFPLVCFFVFIIITLAGSGTEYSKYGSINVFMWLFIAALTVTFGEFILLLVPLIDLYTVSISMALTIVFGIIFFVSSR